MATAGAVAGLGAAAVLSSAASAAPTRYNPIVPYRSIDTRFVPNPEKLQVGFVEDWDLITDQNGNTRITDPTLAAVTFNLTVTQTEGQGFLGILPANVGFPGISTLNWTVPNLDIANGGTVQVGPSTFTGPGSVTVLCGGNAEAKTYYIIDVTGYYAA